MEAIKFFLAFVLIVACGFGVYKDITRVERIKTESELKVGERYRRAVEDLELWCAHSSPHAKLIAIHLKAHGEGLGVNSGTPSGKEACTIQSLRVQLERLDEV